MNAPLKTPRTGAVNPVNLLALAEKLEAVADRVSVFDDETACCEAAEALRELADLRTPDALPDARLPGGFLPVGRADLHTPAAGPDDAERLSVAGQLLGDIAQHIKTARDLLREVADTDPVHGVADLLAVAGFLADFGAGLAGEAGHPGDSCDWLMKPTTRAAVAALGKGRA